MKKLTGAFLISCSAGAAYAHPSSLPHSHDGTGVVAALALIAVAGLASLRFRAKS